MGRWLTPDSSAAAGLVTCRRFRLSGDLLYLLSGAFLELTYSYNWEQFGDMTPDQIAEYFDQVLRESEDGCMVGTLVEYITAAPPDGVLAADGSIYDRVDYPLLYDALDPIYIIDADTFRVPDLQGRTVIGTGNGAGLTARSLDDSGGDETVVLTEAQMPAHSHVAHDHGVSAADPVAGVPLPSPAIGAPTPTGSTGGNQAHDNMPPFTAIHIGVWYR